MEEIVKKKFVFVGLSPEETAVICGGSTPWTFIVNTLCDMCSFYEHLLNPLGLEILKMKYINWENIGEF